MAQSSRDLCYQAKTLTVFFAYRPKYSYDGRGIDAAIGRSVSVASLLLVVDLTEHLSATPRPGRFVLTGSHNLLLMSGVAQTLAGRTAVLHLLPLSRAELEGQDQPEPADPGSLFSNTATALDLWTTIRAGFYPRIHDRGVPPEVWLPDYLQTYLERDVRTLTHVGDLGLFERFLSLTAGRVAQLLNYSSVANDCVRIAAVSDGRQAPGNHVS
jgi:predicted AAA+ superfamily ATPase